MSAIAEGAVVSCYVDAASFLLVFLLLTQPRPIRRQGDESTRILRRLTLCVALNCAVCFCFHAMYMQPAPWCHGVAVASKTAWECLIFVSDYLWIDYVSSRLFGQSRRRALLQRLSCLPFAALTVLLAVNLFSGIVFTVSPDNRFVPGPLFYVIVAADCLYFLSALVHVAYYDRATKRTRFLRVSPTILSVGAAFLLQYLLPDDMEIMSFAIGVTLLYFSMMDEYRFLDQESGFCNRSFLYVLTDLSISGKRVLRSALIFEVTGNLKAAMDILREETRRYGDIVRVERNRFLLFTEQDTLSMIQMWSSVVTEAAEHYNAAHPDEQIDIKVRGRLRQPAEDVFAFINSTVEDRESGSYFKGLTSMMEDLDRLDEELSLAADIQKHALPMRFPPFPDRREFDLYASMNAAKEVGGDFYDFFLVDDDHLAMVIADVSGKGVPAALFMMVSKALIKNQLMAGLSPAEALANVNLQLCDRNEDKMFVTVWAAVLEISTGRGTACNAGHENPALQTDGRFELIEYRHNMFIGVSRKARYVDRPFALKSGDSLFVYTDGVPEATNAAQEMFGAERLGATLNLDANAEPEALIARVRDAVTEFVNGAEQFDDITMLSLKYRGPAPKPADKEVSL